MRHFFIAKTGLESFDLCRAYGLALVIEKLKKRQEEVVIKDAGLYYLIESPGIDIRRRQNAIGLIPSGLRRKTIKSEPRWDQVLRTYKKSGDPVKRQKFKHLKKILADNLKSILGKYSEMKHVSTQNTKLKSTLYGTIEPSAFKGVREAKRGRRYTEGGPYKIDEDDLVLCSIGSAWSSIWILGKEGSINIIGKPSNGGIGVASLMQTKGNISDQIWYHKGGVMPTVTWTAVAFLKTIEQFKSEELFVLFDDLYFNVLKWTGNQPKPEKGGKFSLEFLNNLSKNLDKEDFLDLMESWMNLFKISNWGGLEQLAITLTEFISNPNLSNFERYLKTHLHLNLNQKVGILYNQKLIKELTHYVST